MYSSINIQLYSTLHYLFSFFVLFSLAPRFIFQSNPKGTIEYWFSGYVKMVFLVIILGYVLVITKLYEVLSILLLFSIWIGLSYKKTRAGKEGYSIPSSLKRLFDLLDGVTKTNRKALMTKWMSQQKSWVQEIRRTFHWPLLAEAIALVGIMGVAVFVRFYDTFKNAAPPLSDSYVTLAWMKYINNRVLFHDGIYP